MNKFCSNCGKELKDGADICLNCGKNINSSQNDEKISKNKNPNSRAQILLIIVFILLGIWFYNSFSSLGDIFKKEEDTTNYGYIEFNTIYEEYKENEIRAKEKYENKYYDFKGTVDSVSEIFGDPAVYLRFNCMEIATCKTTVYFEESQTSQIAKLNKGDEISFTGKISGGNGTFAQVTINSATLK